VSDRLSNSDQVTTYMSVVRSALVD
ncbi:uncharacterized protein METZ01_LOCUS327072, partial [marine metagenome]